MTTTRGNVTMTDEPRFEVLNLVSIQLPGPWWWQTQDMNDAGAVGAIFRCYEQGNENELGYLLVADVSQDPGLIVFLRPGFAVSWCTMDEK